MPDLALPGRMLVWTVTWSCLGWGLRELFPDLDLVTGALRLRGERRELIRVTQLLMELEETLSAGALPRPERWEALDSLPAPWGELASRSLRELRVKGAAVIPTLKRLRALAEEHSATLADAQAKSSQALAQAGICAALVPFFGGALYFLLPSVSSHPRFWLSICLVALLLAALSVSWMLSITDQARWVGLIDSRKPWILACQCAGERLLALIRSGVPPDMAWTGACELLARQAPELSSAWGHSVFGGGVSDRERESGSSAGLMIQAGASIRKAVHLSLMEGRSCSERVETVLLGLRQDLRARMERELSVLPTRCLLPLFLLVAPALFGLLVSGLFLEWKASQG